MAKDKGGKPDKSKFGNDDFAKPSDAPAGGDGWKLEDDDNVGKLFLISPLRTHTVNTKEYGDSEVVVADIIELNEKKIEKSVEHADSYIFGGWTKGAVRGFIGERRVLGRLDKDKSKGRGGKNSYAWVLEDADADDVKVAKAYLEQADPFKQKGSKSEKSDKGEKSAKSKSGKSSKGK
jgi:hypothetical protein